MERTATNVSMGDDRKVGDMAQDATKCPNVDSFLARRDCIISLLLLRRLSLVLLAASDERKCKCEKNVYEKSIII